MNFGKNRNPKLRTQTPSYHLAPNFTSRPDGPFRLGTIVNNLAEYFPLNQGLDNLVPIPDGQRHHCAKSSESFAGVQQSRDGQGGVLAKALDGIIGGNASIHMGRYDGDIYRIDNVETTHFYPTDDYYEKCLQLHDVNKFIKGFKYKKPVYLITGLKVAHRASITMESRRQIGADTEASVPVPIAPVDLEVGAQAGVSSSSEVMSSFTQDDAFVLAIQVQKIYHKRAFLSGETKLATKPVFEGAVLVDDSEIGRKDKEADEVNYELHDLDEEDMKRPTLLNSEDGDEA